MNFENDAPGIVQANKKDENVNIQSIRVLHRSREDRKQAQKSLAKRSCPDVSDSLTSNGTVRQNKSNAVDVFDFYLSIVRQVLS